MAKQKKAYTEEELKNLSEKDRIKFQNKQNLKGKERLNHFVDYYLLRVVILIVVLAVVSGSIYQCATRILPDISILILGEGHLAETEIQEQMNVAVSKMVDDVNGDGHSSVQVINIFMPDPDADPTYYSSVVQKRMMELAVGSADLVILSQQQYNETRTATEGFYRKIDNIVGDKTKNGYTIKFGDTTLSNDPAFACVPKDYLIALRFDDQSLSGKKKEAYQARRNESIELLKKIIQ